MSRGWDARRASHGVVALATLALLAWLVIPQAIARSDAVGDAPGHVAVAAFLRDTLLPSTSGFNPQFFCGFEQGQFYPPLFHVAVALVGGIVEIEFAYRLVVAASVALLPWLLFRTARRLGMAPQRSVVAMFLGLAVLATSPYLGGGGRATGATFHSTYVVGLGANAFALVLWLEFVARVPRALARERGDWRLAAVVGGGVLASHFVCGVAAAIYGAVAAVVVVLSTARIRRFAVVRRGMCLAVGVGAVAAFFIVPFVRDRAVSGVRGIDAGDVPLTFALAVLTTLALISRAVRGGRIPLGARVAASFALTVALGLPLAERLAVGAHLDRFHPFAQLAAALALVAALPRGFALGVAGACSGALVIAMATVTSSQLPAPPRPPVVELPALQTESRVLVVGHPNHTPGRHWLHNLVPRATGAGAALGLFVESSPVARTIFDVATVIEPDVVRWGVDGDAAESAVIHGLLGRDDESRGRWLAWALDSFGIDYVLTERRLPGSLHDPAAMPVCDVAVGGGESVRFSMHRLVPSPLVAPLREGVLPIPSSDRAEAVLATHRWLAGGGSAPLPVLGAEWNLSERSAAVATRVRIESISLREPRLRFVVESDAPQPILVKIGWHPRLVARSGASRIPVLRAGNGLCVVLAHGEVEVTMEAEKARFVTALGSMLATSILLGAAIRRRVRKSHQASRFVQLGAERLD